MKKSDPRFLALLRDGSAIDSAYTTEACSVSNRVKNFLKKWPWLFNLLKKLIGPNHSPGSGFHLRGRVENLFGDTPDNSVVLNLGSGTNRVHPEIFNIDIFAFKNVDIVADINDMPLRDEVVDGIVCDTVLEHLREPLGALQEMSRIMRPGGTLILSVPFLYPYHSSPDDFFRWTEEGIRHVLKRTNFHVEELGVLGGPMGALQGVLMHIFAILFSFGSKTAYFLLVQFFMALFSPLKILDLFFMRFPYAIEVSSGIFVVAQKNKS